MVKKAKDLTGKMFNGIRVLERDYDKQKKDKYNKVHWVCECHCGNTFSASSSNLRRGNTKSCGCQAGGKGKTRNGKMNKWLLFRNIAIGVTHDHRLFFVDRADLTTIKKYRWGISNNGYVVANSKDTTNSTLRIHRLVTNATEQDIVDHKNWNKLDNRKTNLRVCNKSDNNVNIKRKSNNTSGYTGVKKNKQGKWVGQISYGGMRKHLGNFDTLQEAVEARRGAELKIHKEFNGEINRKDYPGIIKEEALEPDMEEADGE